jgi:hypothetical protein
MKLKLLGYLRNRLKSMTGIRQIAAAELESLYGRKLAVNRLSLWYTIRI